MNLTIPDLEYKELLEHSRMLGTIGVYVEDFCNEEDTTLMGVIRLLAEYSDMRSQLLYVDLDKLRKEQDANNI